MTPPVSAHPKTHPQWLMGCFFNPWVGQFWIATVGQFSVAISNHHKVGNALFMITVT